jgi:type IV secretion system protein TrbL
MRPTWNPVGDWVSGLADDAIGNLAKAIMEGMSQMVTTLSTFWVKMPTANLTTADGTKPSVPVTFLQDELATWTMTLAVLAVILGGIRMIWEQRGAPLKDLLRSLLTLTLVSGLGLGTIAILVVAADAFSTSIIEASTDGKGFAHAMNILIQTNQTGVGVFILIILGLVGLLASLVQIVLMVVRTGMLVILAGILPTTAAFTNTEMGRQWFQKAVGWTIAFILYKPAAAVVYAVAFKLMGASAGGDVLLRSITGFALMIVALLALPALMRFVTPMVGAVASGSGGGAGAVAGAMATGAVSLGRSGSGRGNASPTPPSQPSQIGASAKGSQGAGGSSGGNGKPTPASTGPSGPGGAPRKGTSGSAGASAGSGAGTAGARAASGAAKAAGPTGLVVAAGVQVASRASQAAQQTAQDSTGEGPSGSN